MALRLIEATVPDEQVEEARELLSHDDCLALWSFDLDGEHTVVAAVLHSQDVERLLDRLSVRFESDSGFRVMVYAVEAMLPRPVEKLKEKDAAERTRDRVSREELYERIRSGAELNRTFLLQVFLSTAVAVIGLLRNDLAVIIGAMVIAPLLGPNVALALSTVLSDARLAASALKTNIAGVGFAVSLSIALGVLSPSLLGALGSAPATLAEIPAVAARTRVGPEDLILASASGAAGVLAFTTGVPASLIGVMVAVALLPPAAVFGLLLGGGEWPMAGQALLLLSTNVICVNLSAVAMFAVKGVSPRRWMDADRARSATINAIVIWGFLFVLLASLILRFALPR